MSRNPGGATRRPGRGARAAGFICAALLAAGCAAPPRSSSPPQPLPASAARLAADSGIEVTAVRLSAAGRLVDFRYRVLDARKAKMLLGKQIDPYALDQATGVRLAVPRAGKIGPLRQTAREAAEGRVYFILFGNTGNVVKRGSLVTVVLGELLLPDLVVE